MAQLRDANTLKVGATNSAVSCGGNFRPEDNIVCIFGPIGGRSSIVNLLPNDRDIVSPFPNIQLYYLSSVVICFRSQLTHNMPLVMTPQLFNANETANVFLLQRPRFFSPMAPLLALNS